MISLKEKGKLLMKFSTDQMPLSFMVISLQRWLYKMKVYLNLSRVKNYKNGLQKDK